MLVLNERPLVEQRLALVARQPAVVEVVLVRHVRPVVWAVRWLAGPFDAQGPHFTTIRGDSGHLVGI